MTLESALIPLPSEITMPFSGFLVQRGELILPLVILMGAFGNLLGSLIAYGIGYFLEETIVINMLHKYGKFFLITGEEYDKATGWFQKYGDGVVFFSRVLPGIRTFISLPAGICKVNLWRFSVYTLVGSLVWSTTLTLIGFYLGENWQRLERYFRQFELLIATLLVLAFLWYLNHKLRIIKIF